ncbi:VOC family protein [Bacillus sp. T33-2]|uniref:VOC family protein n=1 Tax=Bacillus sp. T33-2 TaxID=2054168 RepID=UPI000C779E36|nr:VOC family protein [Bacillus sp. T33-2]PLR96786.1 glyoxalase [Bacillus sp. T33-2]
MGFHQKATIFVRDVHLLVQDLQRSLSFYQDVIGFKTLSSSASQAVLTADGVTPLLKIEQPENPLPRKQNRTGLYHFALLLPDRSDLARVLLHLLQSGYPLQGASDHLVSEALYLADPDGNGIEIYSDRPSETWKWQNGQVIMATEPLNGEDLLAATGGVKWAGLPEGTVMGHIHLQVADLDKAERFYCEGLGFELVNSLYGQSARFVSSSGYHHHIGLNTWHSKGAPAPEKNSAGLKSYSVVLPDENSRDETVQRLQQMGEWVIEQNGLLLTKDPSGNVIHLLV